MSDRFLLFLLWTLTSSITLRKWITRSKASRWCPAFCLNGVEPNIHIIQLIWSGPARPTLHKRSHLMGELHDNLRVFSHKVVLFRNVVFKVVKFNNCRFAPGCVAIGTGEFEDNLPGAVSVCKLAVDRMTDKVCPGNRALFVKKCIQETETVFGRIVGRQISADNFGTSCKDIIETN